MFHTLLMRDKTQHKAKDKVAKPGDRLVHKDIDNEFGLAKTGIAVEEIGDDEQKLVVGIWEGEDKPVAFDSREVKNYGNPKKSRGPIITNLRHVKALFKRKETLLAILYAVLAGIALSVTSTSFDFSSAAIWVTGAVLVGIGLLAFNRLEVVMSSDNLNTKEEKLPEVDKTAVRED